MADIRKVEQAISKAVAFLVSAQNEDGSWTVVPGRHSEPQYLEKSIAITSELTLAVILNAHKDNINPIIKGINFCLTYPLDPYESVDLWGLRLLTLRYANSALARKICEKIYGFISIRQTKAGYWRNFPSTFNLTNWIAACALTIYNPEKKLLGLVNWFKRNKAQDGFGWGVDGKAAKSEPSFTSNVVLASLSSGADPTEAYLQKAREFLASKQFKNGGWYSSSFTVANKPTTYSTALCTQALMLLSENIFNKNVEKGIDFLLKSQNSKGYWSLLAGEKQFIPYTSYYVLETLSFYLFLKKMWKDEKIAKLRDCLSKPQYFAIYLLGMFREQTKNRLFSVLHSNLLSSKLLGATQQAVERRTDILRYLNSDGEMDVAELMDCMKKEERYAFLNKRKYYTQIKADLDFLSSLNLVKKRDERYFSVFDLSSD
ncbi:MAG: prenyltransferase/squalene oxidase repeat-containing protein [archaeon]